jgi:hypothetical protein
MKHLTLMQPVIQSITVVIRGGVEQRALTHAGVHWWLGLIAVVLVSVGVVWWSVSIYMQYRDDVYIEVSPATGVTQVYRAGQVSAALAEIAARQTVREQLLARARSVSSQTLTPAVVVATTTPVVTPDPVTAYTATTTTSEAEEIVSTDDVPPFLTE